MNPTEAGLGSGRRRRTPGLRREEVAELAGIGIDWYIRLEQGRAVCPSLTTIDALARALRLGDAERAHLRALARGPDRHAFARETVPGTIRRLVEALSQPAYVTGRRWDILAWNEAAATVFTDFGRLEEADSNILVFMLLNPEARRLFGAGWTEEAQRMVAQFRATHDLWAGDPAFLALTQRLLQSSPDFTRWWDSHDVRGAAAGQKRLIDARGGSRRFEYATFQANDDPALKLVIYTPL